MKNLKELLAMLLSLGLILAVCMPVFADGTEPVGTVTVNNAENGKSYDLYQVLVPEGDGYAVAESWNEKVKIDNGKVYFNFSEESTEWSELKEPVSSETIMAFLAYAETLDPKKTAEAAEGKAIFSEVPYGYYLIDYADGTGGLFELKSDSLDIEKKKTDGPSVVKKIKLANGDLVDWTTVNDGDVVTFDVEITLPSEDEWKDTPYSYGCLIEDQVSDGLRQNQDVEIKLDGKTVIEPGEVKATLSDKPGDVIRIEYSNDEELDKRKHFAIRFGVNNEDGSGDGTLAFLKLHPGAKLHLSYSATVINRAIQVPEDFNTVTYWYGGKSVTDTVYVYDFTIVINKFESGNNGKGLDGAEFVLQNEEGKFYWSDQKSDPSNHAGDKVKWLDAKYDKETGEFTLPDGITERLSMVRVTDKWNLNGVTHFEGIPTGTYKLYEIKAPEGYVRMKEPIEIVISHDGTKDDGKEKFSYTINGSNPSAITGGEVPWGSGWDQLQLPVKVENTKEDALLPSTGGIGTTIFYVAGAVLMIGAGIILFKRRKSV